MPETKTETRQELVSAGYPTQDVLIERTVVESGDAGIYKSILTTSYQNLDGSTTRHACCPIITTDAHGGLPTIQSEKTNETTETSKTQGTSESAEWVIKEGLSYADYLKAADILAKIAAGGSDIMHVDFSKYLVTGQSVNQITTITNTNINVDNVPNAIIPMADIEKELRPPGASLVTPVGLVPLTGSTGTSPFQPLPKPDTTHLQSAAAVLDALGGNQVKVGPTTFISKLSVDPAKPDMLNKFSVPSKGVMDKVVVTNDSTLFVNYGTTSGQMGSRVLTDGPVK